MKPIEFGIRCITNFGQSYQDLVSEHWTNFWCKDLGKVIRLPYDDALKEMQSWKIKCPEARYVVEPL